MSVVQALFHWPTCDPNKQQKTLWITQFGQFVLREWHCYRMACSNCNRALSTFRARALINKLREARLATVWFGQVDSKAISSAKKYKQHHPEAHRVLTSYFDTDIRVLLSTENMIPRRQILKELSLEDAVNQWLGYSLAYRAKRTDSDWDLSKVGYANWVANLTNHEHLEAYTLLEQHYGYNPGDPLNDTDIRHFLSLLEEIRNPRDYSNLYG